MAGVGLAWVLAVEVLVAKEEVGVASDHAGVVVPGDAVATGRFLQVCHPSGVASAAWPVTAASTASSVPHTASAAMGGASRSCLAVQAIACTVVS